MSSEKPDVLVCPLTAELIDPSDVDQLAEALQRCSEELDKLHRWHWRLRQEIAKHAPGETKTRRVRGRRYRLVLTFPSSTWDQSILKEAWNSYPRYRDQLLRIERIGIKHAELKKVRNESGPPDWETFKKMVLSAERPSSAPPSVKIEEVFEETPAELGDTSVEDVWG